MKLDMEVGLGPVHIVLDGDPAPPPLKGQSRWIKMPLGREVGLGPGDIVRLGASPSPKGTQTPNFRSMSIVTKRSPISATAEHLFVFSFSSLLFLVFFGSVPKIKLANRRLWARENIANRIILSYCISPCDAIVSPSLCASLVMHTANVTFASFGCDVEHAFLLTVESNVTVLAVFELTTIY